MKKREQMIRNTVLLLICSFLCVGCGKQSDEHISQGMQQISQFDYTGALESFEAAIVYNEDSELLYRGQGLAYMGLGQYEDAVEAFLQSFRYAQGKTGRLQFDTNYYLAASYYKLGQFENAEKVYTAMIDMNNKEKDAYFLRACSLLKQGYSEAAILDFEKAFSLAPSDIDLVSDAYLEMQDAGFEAEGKAYIQEYMVKQEKTMTDSQKGILFFYLEDYANARTFLDGALKAGDAEISLILGKTYEKLGDLNYASVVYQTYLDSNTADAAIYNSLGNCLFQQQKYQDALHAFEAGLEIGDSAYIQNLSFNQIVAYEYLGNFSKAKQLMEQYLVRYPDDGKAMREYDFLVTR